jgi:hypothetical protein
MLDQAMRASTELVGEFSIAPADAQGVWRDISSAPRDGTRFIAYEPTYGVGSAFWQTITNGSYADEVETISGWRMNGMLFREGDIDQPTHWMPLPAAPSQKGHSNDR